MEKGKSQAKSYQSIETQTETTPEERIRIYLWGGEKYEQRERKERDITTKQITGIRDSVPEKGNVISGSDSREGEVDRKRRLKLAWQGTAGETRKKTVGREISFDRAGDRRGEEGASGQPEEQIHKRAEEKIYLWEGAELGRVVKNPQEEQSFSVSFWEPGNINENGTELTGDLRGRMGVWGRTNQGRIQRNKEVGE